MNFIHSIPIEFRLAVLFLLGCCAGSAINLGIYRLAWHKRPISPWSRPDPKAPPRRLSDWLPVIGWLGLRREAKLHKPGIWIRSMVLELLTGAAFALLYWWEIAGHGLVPKYPEVFVPVGVFDPAKIEFALWVIRHQEFVAHVALYCFMLVAFWTDVDETTVPDGVTIPGTLAGLFLVTLWPYALLPDIVPATHGPDLLTFVWLNSPSEHPPWDIPILVGWPALAGAIAVFWIWCLALVERGLWSTRHGFSRAVKVCTAHVVREKKNLGLLVLAVLGSLGIAWIWRVGGPHWAGLASGLAGIAVGGGMVWLVRISAGAVMDREAMGFGDVTLLAMIGAFLGWQAMVVVFFLGPLLAVGFGLCRLLLRGQTEIFFGPFLCAGAAVTVLGWTDRGWPSVLGGQGIWEFCDRYFSLGGWLIVIVIVALGLMVVLLPPVHWIVTRLRPK
jgi:leader peptidase (prepilin peptidase) / N-methyltransferase